MWRGIYIGPTDGGISPLIPEGTLAKYESTECKDLIVTSANGSEQTPYKLSNGEMMNPAGRSGCFTMMRLVLSLVFLYASIWTLI